MDPGHCLLFSKVVVIENGVNNMVIENGVNNMVIKAEFAELKDIRPGTLISYGGHYYIKSTEVKVDRACC